MNLRGIMPIKNSSPSPQRRGERRGNAEGRQETSLFLSLRDLGVLCASAVRAKLFTSATTLRLAVFVTLIINCGSMAYGQFIESFGHVGAVRIFKGQVRDGSDEPIPHAKVVITRLTTGKIYSTNADGNGCFKKDGLPLGKYRIKVDAIGFNIGEYTVNINQYSSAASRKYIAVRLSPGCASGNSGIALVNKIKDPSFQQE